MTEQPVRPRRPGRRGDRGLAAGHAPPPAARRGSRPSPCRLAEAARPGHRRPGLGPPVLAGRTTPPRWTASPCAPPTPSARARPRRCCSRPATSRSSTPATRCRPGRDAVVMREHVHRTAGRRGRAAGRRPAVPARPVDRRGRRAGELLLPEGHRLRPFDLAAAAAAGRDRPARCGARRGSCWCRPATRSGRSACRWQPGEIPDTNSLMLAGAGPRGWVRGDGARRSCRTSPPLIAAAVHAAAAVSDLVIVLAGSSAGRDDYTAQVVADDGRAGGARRRGPARAPGRARASSTRTPVIGAPGYPVSAALTFDIFAAPLLAALEGTAPARRPTTTARLARKLALAGRHGRLGAGPARAGSAGRWSRPRCRAAPAC